MNIYVDFDGTIVDTVGAIVSLYNKDFHYYSKYKHVKPEDINSWDFAECNCASKEYINTYFNQDRFFKELLFMPDAYNALRKLKLLGHRIIVVSMGYSPNLRLKKKWISYHLDDVASEFIPVNFKEYPDKSHIDMSDGIFIDDSYMNLATSNAKTCVLYGERKSWNERWQGIHYTDWWDIYRLIREGSDKF